MANRKITVIGAGSVGATTAFALTVRDIANEIVLVDINESKALGEAMDIRQCTPLLENPINVYAGNYESAARQRHSRHHFGPAAQARSDPHRPGTDQR